MTNKEAIEILDTLIISVVSQEEIEALNMAIDALEDEKRCGNNERFSEFIERGGRR